MINLLRIYEILQTLDHKDPLFLQKLNILQQLAEYPDRGHIINKKIVDWCKEQKFNVNLETDSGQAWWSCKI